MKQRSFSFRNRGRRQTTPEAELQWPFIVTHNPGRYAGLLLELALRVHHRCGRAHDQALCPFCRDMKGEVAA
jgi:hypothetical protein